MESGKRLWSGLLLGSALALSLSAARADEPIATGTNGDRIDLYDEQGAICPDGLKRAVYSYLPPHPRAGETVEGCWRSDSVHVLLAFADGDRGALDVDVFTWRQGHTGQRL